MSGRDPRLDTVPAGRLVGIQDIADMLGVKRDTVDLWRLRDKKGRSVVSPMPTPILPAHPEQKVSPLWDREEVMRWAHATGRVKTQRPPVVVPE